MNYTFEQHDVYYKYIEYTHFTIWMTVI